MRNHEDRAADFLAHAQHEGLQQKMEAALSDYKLNLKIALFLFAAFAMAILMATSSGIISPPWALVAFALGVTVALVWEAKSPQRKRLEAAEKKFLGSMSEQYAQEERRYR